MQEERETRGQQSVGCARFCLFGLLGALALGAMAFGAIYWAAFHSSLPLGLVESLLESTGVIEVEGLSGSISSGFHADRLRFRSAEDRWSSLSDVDFEFNGLRDVLGSDRLLIERIHVGSGEIYVGVASSSEVAVDAGADPDVEPTPPESEATWPIEVRIDRIEFADLRFVAPESDFEFDVREFTLDGFHVVDGHLTHLGDVTFDSSRVELRSGPSRFFADRAASGEKRNFSGVVRSSASDSLLADVPYDVDVCLDPEEGVLVHARLCDGRLVFDTTNAGRSTTEFADFTPADYVRWEHGLLPEHVSATLTSTAQGTRRSIAIAPGATFALGELTFDVETREVSAEEDAPRSPPVLARHAAAGGRYTCELRALADAPFVVLSLRSEAEQPSAELYAEVFFGAPPDALDARSRELIEKTLAAVADTR